VFAYGRQLYDLDEHKPIGSSRYRGMMSLYIGVRRGCNRFQIAVCRLVGLSVTSSEDLNVELVQKQKVFAYCGTYIHYCVHVNCIYRLQRNFTSAQAGHSGNEAGRDGKFPLYGKHRVI
jgi:hypothetical protein